MKSTLIQKYNVPGPRYTSYPTVPYWNETDFLYEDYTYISPFVKVCALFVDVINALPKTMK